MFRGRGRGSGGAAGRGRGAVSSAHKGSAPPAKHTTAVPAFPVVARDNGGDEAPPVAVSARRSSHGEADDDDAHAGFVPPSAVRARGRGGDRGGRSRGNAERGGFRGGRGSGRGDTGGFRSGLRGGFRGGDRGGFRGGGRGGFQRGRGGAARRDNEHATVEGEAEEAHTSAEKNHAPTHVITTMTDSGTELPRRLNTKVFIDGLPYTYPPEPGKPTLEDEVMQFATAWKVGKPLRLIKKPGQGFGFLVLQSPNSVSTAVRVLNGRKFLGRALRVEEPKPKDLEKMKDIGGMKDMGKESFTRQVLLSDLAKVAQPEIIREVLRDVAPQLEKKLEAIKMTSQNRKAFLTFETEAEVGPAINFLDGFHLLGRRISATQAAAPGSLPFSHGGTGPSRGGLAAAAAAATAAGTAPSQEEEEELTVVPLGMAPVKTSTATGGATAAASPNVRRREEAGAAAAGTGSNVTGRTEKYNLLDDGPRDVYVGNLADDVTEAQLRQHFAPCGAIRRCEIIVHPETHLSTGIAHIEFALPAYAAYAQERYHGSRLRGSVLRVDRGDTASVPLAAELPPAEEEDDYDEDAYMERYGVKDKKAFFKGTSIAAEMGADPHGDDDEEEEEEDVEAVKKSAKKNKRQRAEEKKGKKATASSPVEKRARAEAATAAPAGKKGKGKDANSAKAGKAVDEDEENDMNLITSHAMEDSDEEEEHFYDADTVPVAAATGAAGANASKAAPSGKKSKKNKFKGKK